MGNLRACLAALVLVPAVSACGNSDNNTKVDAPIHVIDAAIDAPPPIDAAPDAQTFNFACAGVPNATTTLATTITVGGLAETLNVTSLAPAPDVTVELFKTGNDTALDTVISASDGSFSFAAQTTNGSALDLFIKGTKTGDRPNIVIPAAPLVADQPNVPVLALTTGTFSTLVGLAQSHQTAGNGAIGLAVTDCLGTSIAGATLSVKQGNTDVGDVFDVGSLAAQAKGTYFVFDIPPGDTTIIATVGTQVFRTRVITSVADATTTTQLLP